MKVAAAYRRGSQIYIHACARTPNDLWIAAAPFLSLKENASPVEIGAAVVRALDRSHELDNVLFDAEDLLLPLFELAGVKSSKAFFSNTTRCSILEDEGRLTYRPMARKNKTGSFLPLAGVDLTVDRSSASSTAIGEALLTSLDRCP